MSRWWRADHGGTGTPGAGAVRRPLPVEAGAATGRGRSVGRHDRRVGAARARRRHLRDGRKLALPGPARPGRAAAGPGPDRLAGRAPRLQAVHGWPGCPRWPGGAMARWRARRRRRHRRCYDRRGLRRDGAAGKPGRTPSRTSSPVGISPGRYGLRTDPEGRPVAVRVFGGNTADPAAFTKILGVVHEDFQSSGFVLFAGIGRFAANGPAFGETSLESGEPVSCRSR